MTAYELISRKQNGVELCAEEIECMISGFAKGTLPDYQMAAFLMTVYFKGRTEGETNSVFKWLLIEVWIAANFCSDVPLLNFAIARSRRRKG